MKPFFTHMSAVFLILSLATSIVGEGTPRDLEQSLQLDRQKEVLLTKELAILGEKVNYSLSKIHGNGNCVYVWRTSGFTCPPTAISKCSCRRTGRSNGAQSAYRYTTRARCHHVKKSKTC